MNNGAASTHGYNRKLITGIGAAVAALFLLLGLIYHFRLIAFPYQIEFREAAILQTTEALRNGVDIYDDENLPRYYNLFGIAYNIVALPFSYLPFDEIHEHRVVTALCIFGLVVLCLLAMRRLRVPWWMALPAMVSIYVMFLYGHLPIPRPDAFGTLVYALALLLPFFYRYRLWSLVVSAALAVLGLYTKLYFVVAFPIVAIYVFLFINKRNAIVSSGFFFLLLIGSIALVDAAAPNYFRSVVLVADNATTYTHLMIYLQLRDFFLRLTPGYVALFAIGAAMFLLQVIKTKRVGDFIPKFSLASWRNGLLRVENPPTLFLTVMAVAFVLYVIRLGGHGGSYMTYFIELFGPFFIMETARLATQQRVSPYIAIALMLVSMSSSYRFLDGLTSDVASFRKAEDVVASSTNPLCSPALGSVLLERNLPMVDNGLTEYYKHAWYVKSETFDVMFDNDMAIKNKFTGYIDSVHRNVADKQYDVVLMPRRDWLQLDSVLTLHYDVKDSVLLKMPQYFDLEYKLYISRPKP